MFCQEYRHRSEDTLEVMSILLKLPTVRKMVKLKMKSAIDN